MFGVITSLSVRFVLGTILALYVTAPLSSLGLLPMVVGLIIGFAGYMPTYNFISKHA